VSLPGHDLKIKVVDSPEHVQRSCCGATSCQSQDSLSYRRSFFCRTCATHGDPSWL